MQNRDTQNKTETAHNQTHIQMSSKPIEELQEYGRQLQQKFQTGVSSMQARLDSVRGREDVLKTTEEVVNETVECRPK